MPPGRRARGANPLRHTRNQFSPFGIAKGLVDGGAPHQINKYDGCVFHTRSVTVRQSSGALQHCSLACILPDTNQSRDTAAQNNKFV
jgi:hypothetical protein